MTPPALACDQYAQAHRHPPRAEGLRHISEFLPSPENLLAVGDAWDRMIPEARHAILMLTGFAWVGSSGKWADIPAQARVDIAHGVVFFRDFLNRVLP